MAHSPSKSRKVLRVKAKIAISKRLLLLLFSGYINIVGYGSGFYSLSSPSYCALTAVLSLMWKIISSHLFLFFHNVTGWYFFKKRVQERLKLEGHHQRLLESEIMKDQSLWWRSEKWLQQQLFFSSVCAEDYVDDEKWWIARQVSGLEHSFKRISLSLSFHAFHYCQIIVTKLYERSLKVEDKIENF